MNQQINLAIVDDHLLFQELLVSQLSKKKNIKVVFVASNGQQLLQKLATQTVDIVLLDIEMPFLNGRETLACLQHDFPKIKTIMLSMHEEPSVVSSLIKDGANAYLKKNCTYKELIDAVFDVSEKGYHHNEVISTLFFNTLNNHSNTIKTILKNKLSIRDEIILTLICDGKKSVEIAELLYLSKKSIDTLRTDLLKRLGATNSANLVTKCILLGLYKPRTEEEMKAFEVALRAKLSDLKIKNNKRNKTLIN
jgi:DNA-binding NarL/FixJ family response regulator